MTAEDPPTTWFLGYKVQAPRPPDPPEEPRRTIQLCAGCAQKIWRRETGIGFYLYVNSRGFGNCRKGGMHKPAT